MTVVVKEVAFHHDNAVGNEVQSFAKSLCLKEGKLVLLSSDV